jgi:hypothetical protein
MPKIVATTAKKCCCSFEMAVCREYIPSNDLITLCQKMKPVIKCLALCCCMYIYTTDEKERARHEEIYFLVARSLVRQSAVSQPAYWPSFHALPATSVRHRPIFLESVSRSRVPIDQTKNFARL